uniref:Uncharacterized protein n=1 Tax=Branchiostoma floridae TaxID=7739 RepID=C3Z5V1_BRAFL|eukprot:XP_002596202.1 hypothetical protein BRAFLDRAFT_66051 [Branchiostoma floridae]
MNLLHTVPVTIVCYKVSLISRTGENQWIGQVIACSPLGDFYRWKVPYMTSDVGELRERGIPREWNSAFPLNKYMSEGILAVQSSVCSFVRSEDGKHSPDQSALLHRATEEPITTRPHIVANPVRCFVTRSGTARRTAEKSAQDQEQKMGDRDEQEQECKLEQQDVPKARRSPKDLTPDLQMKEMPNDRPHSPIAQVTDETPLCPSDMRSIHANETTKSPLTASGTNPAGRLGPIRGPVTGRIVLGHVGYRYWTMLYVVSVLTWLGPVRYLSVLRLVEISLTITNSRANHASQLCTSSTVHSCLHGSAAPGRDDWRLGLLQGIFIFNCTRIIPNP